ncbi:histidine phosphatase family protein [Merismopedia glauca]|uniref:Histidine phosphatase family protein n=1 Tax=Merismopedia glauca CCAP 1448/3 TaxID=1296344 RepID=A0A2T1C3H8_9CYAN|nr:histidine phosphatase family protein [Merismopedia glauca]PSB02826.1 histidine phosphatase family protein [Merismopedia glauca CCAP 1448/3]
MSTRVIIVRHGQSSYNSQGRIQGRSDDSILTEKGKADAAQVANTLKSIQIDAAYCSPLQRAKSTAEIIISGLDSALKLQPDEQLMEIDLPLWENLFKEDVKANFPQEYRAWKEKPHELRMQIPTDDGFKEHYPVLALYKQAREFWQKLLSKHQGETVLIVAHNGINRGLIATAIGMSPDRYHAIQQSNCGITVLNFAGDWGEAVQLESLNLTSHVGETLPKVRPGHQGPRLLLVRHGETEWNRAGRFQGQIDVPLNENGREQSQKAKTFLHDVPLDLAFTSPMLRPKETAEIILEAHTQVNLDTRSGLSEIAHGLWEGKLEAEIDASYPGELQRWRTIPEQVQMPEGENLQQVWDRAIPTWQAIVEEVGASEISRTALVVAHDATNKVILCHILGLKTADFWKIKQGNCAVTVIDYPEGAQGMPVLQSLNITTHLGGGAIDHTAAGAL